MLTLRPSRSTRLRGVLALIGLNLFGFAIALLVAEGAGRLAGLRPRGGNRGDRGLWRYEGLRGWGLIPGAKGEDNRGGPDRGTVRINAQGFRGADFARTTANKTRRVLVLGDSFGFGVGINEEHTMAVRLADLINRDPDLTAGNHVDVLNLSVSGYSTDQQILTYESDGAPLDPSVVILLMCDNDFDGNLQGFAYGRYYKPRFVLEEDGNLRLIDTPAPRGERRRPVRMWLFDHSAIQGALLGISDRPRLRALERFLAPGEARATSVSAEALMLALLQKLNREVTQRGATLVTFNTGHRGEKTPLFQSLRPAMEQAGIAHHGLEAQLGDARARRPDLSWDFNGDTHWNVAANDVASRVIHFHLRKLAREGKLSLSR